MLTLRRSCCNGDLVLGVSGACVAALDLFEAQPFGDRVADRLKHGERVIAYQYEEVTVPFDLYLRPTV